MKDTRTLNLEKRIASANAKAQKALALLQAAQADQKQLTRDARTHRLCVHGGLLEKYLFAPEVFDPEDLDRLLMTSMHHGDQVIWNNAADALSVKET